MATSRFETRKLLIQEEVNAINTTYLRAQLLPAAQREAVTKLLRSYVDTRLEFMNAATDTNRLEKVTTEAAAIQYQLWQLTTFMMSEDPSGSSKQLFVQSLNEMINLNQKRREALINHVPELVIYQLFMVAVGALGFIAYGYGLTGRRRHVSTAIFALLIAFVLATILDLDQPRTGFIQVGEESLHGLKATLDQTSRDF